MSGFFDYFQVTGLAVFLFLFMGKTLYLRLGKKVNAFTLTTRNKGIQGVLEISLFVAVNVWIMEILFYSLHLDFQIFPSPLDIKLLNLFPLKILGVILLVLAFAVFVSALISLGNSWRLGIDEKNPGKLVTHGVYAISRNPVYLFFNLYFIGTFLINGTLIFLLFAIFTALNLHYQILGEERFLLKTFGAAYQNYRVGTNRYFTWPKIWSNIREEASLYTPDW